MSQPLRAIIVDDVPHCISDLQTLLQQEHPAIDLVGTAASVEEGLEVIKELEPDLLFLDIELRDQTSFELLEQIDFGRYAIVFATGHLGYAIRAIEFEAMGYILKPVQSESLTKAINRAKKRLAQRSYEDNTQDLYHLMQQIKTAQSHDRIILSNSEGYHPIRFADITHFESLNGCVAVHTISGQAIVVSANLIEYERQLKGINFFFRCHRSYIVNTKLIIKATPQELQMANNKLAYCSQPNWEELKRRL